MIMRKINQGLTIGVVALFIVCGNAYAEIVDRIVAIVNEDIITLTELNTALRPYVDKIDSAGYTGDQKEKILFKLRTDMLSRMVDRKLTDQEVKRFNITVTDKEIDAAIERLKQAQLMTQEDLETALEKDGMTFADYREKMRLEIMRPKLINYSVKSKVIVTDKEVADYYAEHRAEYAGVRKFRLSNILVNDKSTAETVWNRLETGEDFKTLAGEMSKAPNAEEGGDLGSFALETLSDPLKVAIGKLNPGQYTNVIPTDQGFQIFFLDEIVESKGNSLEEVKDEIQKAIYDRIVEEKFNSWLESLRAKSLIKTML